MAQRSNRRKPAARPRRSWWWIALPLLGVAAYAAFDTTLGLVSPDEPAPTAPVRADGGLAPAAPAAVAPVRAEPSASAATVLGVPVATDAAPTPTADARAAANDDKPAAKKASAKRKPPAPKENLTEQDRRALDRVIERAGEQANDH